MDQRCCGIVPVLSCLFWWCVGGLGTDISTIFPDTREVFWLSGENGTQWRLDSLGNATNLQDIQARVPGDIVSDLYENGLIDDPYFERNFLTQRRVWMGPKNNDNTHQRLEQRTRTWIYSTNFSLGVQHRDDTYVLVLEGVKMGATVLVNDVVLGNVTDQFLRYTFVLDQSVLSRDWLASNNQKQHRLSLVFNPTLPTSGRFMACSGGWDWAPYSHAGDERGSSLWTFGVVKPVYIVREKAVSITHVVPRIYHVGERHPRQRLGPTGDFQVLLDVHLKSTRGHSASDGHLVVRTDFADEVTMKVPSIDQDGAVVVRVPLSADQVKLWWPNGLGDQHLYTIETSYRGQDCCVTEWVSRRIGFRTTALVTFNDTDDSVVNDLLRNKSGGSGEHGMYFRVNGVVLWCRGANVVPMDQLEGRLTDEAHRILVRSAAQANMNMIRVWGGGMIMPESFYRACDEHGILIYHDMMFVEEQFHGAVSSAVVEREIRHLVRQLAQHPCVLVWSGCNECKIRMDAPSRIYVTFVMETVAQEDDTRIIWPSCPSPAGWETGVRSVDGKPNGKRLASKPQNGTYTLERHGPYQHGFSLTYPAVNGVDFGRPYETNIPPIIHNESAGPTLRNQFVSEFGISSYPSFESLSGSLSRHHFSLHGGAAPDHCFNLYGSLNECHGENVMAERNYPCDSHIKAYFGERDLDSVGVEAFQRQLYYCTVATTLWLKGAIEEIRSSNTFGTLVWQLNENWPTGGWGLVEYGSKQGQRGQSVGGRWKPAMHLLRKSLYKPIFCACGKNQHCFCRNNGEHSTKVEVVVEHWNVAESVLLQLEVFELLLEGGIHAKETFTLQRRVDSWRDVAMLSARTSDKATILDRHLILWTEPRFLLATKRPIDVNMTVAKGPSPTSANITISADCLLLFVVLTTVCEGRFDDNFLVLEPGQMKRVSFQSDSEVDLEQLRRSLRLEHSMSYTNARIPPPEPDVGESGFSPPQQIHA